MPIRASIFPALVLWIAATGVTQSGITDEVVLSNGHVLEGRVLSDTSKGVVLQLAFGGVVEFRRADVRNVHRRLGPSPDHHTTSRREQRYLVYHGDNIVGFRAVSHSTGVRRNGRVGDLWRDRVRFHDVHADDGDPTYCSVVTIEFRSADGKQRQLYYREVGLGTDNILDGRWENGQFDYTWIRAGKRSYHSARFDETVRFPTEHWFATNTVTSATPLEARVWDPRPREIIRTRARAYPSRPVALAGRKVVITLVECEDPRGRRMRWIGAGGEVMKEYLNGRALVAVATQRRSIPTPGPNGARIDLEERRRLRVVVDPRSDAVLRVPSVSWHVEERGAGVFAFTNAEVDATIVVHWVEGEAAWPGPRPPAGQTPRPARFGGWAGVGWDEPLEDGRRRLVRRRSTAAGRVVAVLEAPLEMLAPARVDFRALLTESRFRD